MSLLKTEFEKLLTESREFIERIIDGVLDRRQAVQKAEVADVAVSTLVSALTTTAIETLSTTSIAALSTEQVAATSSGQAT